MSILRKFLTILVAAAIATLPLAGGFAQFIAPSDVTVSTVPLDCCDKGEPCAKTMPQCGAMAGCMVKCSGFFASLSAPFAVSRVTLVTERTPLAHQRAVSQSENPPLPPPRV
jgi:hypothetical protein